MPSTVLRPQKEYGIRTGSYEGYNGIYLWIPVENEELFAVIEKGITLNERSFTTPDGEFDIEVVEIVDINNSCCLSTNDHKIIYTFDSNEGTQILEFLGMNLTKVYHNYMEINGDPCLTSTIVRNTDPIVKDTKTAKLILRPGVVYHKTIERRSIFLFR